MKNRDEKLGQDMQSSIKYLPTYYSVRRYSQIFLWNKITILPKTLYLAKYIYYQQLRSIVLKSLFITEKQEQIIDHQLGHPSFWISGSAYSLLMR